MKISTQAWHYRLQKFWRLDSPKALCAYFWTTVVAVLLIPFVVGLGVFGGFLIISPLLLFFLPLELGFVIIGSLIDAALLFAILMHVTKQRRGVARRERISRRLARRAELAELPPKPPSMTWTYIKTVHRKVCPFIEYV